MSQPIAGTVVETYLRDAASLTSMASPACDSIHAAIIVPTQTRRPKSGRNGRRCDRPHGHITGVHRTGSIVGRDKAPVDTPRRAMVTFSATQSGQSGKRRDGAGEASRPCSRSLRHIHCDGRSTLARILQPSFSGNATPSLCCRDDDRPAMARWQDCSTGRGPPGSSDVLSPQCGDSTRICGILTSTRYAQRCASSSPRGRCRFLTRGLDA